MAHPDQQEVAEKFLVDLNESIKSNDIYYKKCLSFVQGHLDFQGIIPTTWDDVVLKPTTRDLIRANSVGIISNMEELASVGMCPNRNMILISPPGMAKTTMFRAISNEMGEEATRIWCTGKSVQYPEHVTSMFEAARALAPCIILIEDMDLFGGERNLTGNSRILNEFLAQLDGTQANAGIVVLASTNDIDSMDEALVNRPGRFSVKVEIPYPDAQDRHLMLCKFLQGMNARLDRSVSKDTWKNIINLTDGLTGDYIKELAKCAVIRAVAEGRGAFGHVVLNTDDLNIAGEQVIKNHNIGKRAKKHHTHSPGDYLEDIEMAGPYENAAY